MSLELYDFDLPPERIALRPHRPRDEARLLCVDGSTDRLSDHRFLDLPSLLAPGDLVVFNDSRVIPAQLFGLRLARELATLPVGGGAAQLGEQKALFGAKIALTLHKRLGPNTWRAFAKPAKKLQPGDRLSFSDDLAARVHEKHAEGDVTLAFDVEGEALDRLVAAAGVVPLPPYIAARRAADEQDRIDYQTVYAAQDGSVAAPTAGLHFTDRLFTALERRGVKTAMVTLHVGAGTFLPVKADRLEDHDMHSEWAMLPAAVADQLNETRLRGGRIIPVGTTALRLLETAATPEGTITPFAGETDLFITPGYRFRACDGLITNFHLPKSTLFMLVCALAGTQRMRAAYAHALASDYRFYSYGDGSLLWAAADARLRPGRSE